MVGRDRGRKRIFCKTRAPSVEMTFLLGAKKKAGADACGNCGILLVGRKR